MTSRWIGLVILMGAAGSLIGCASLGPSHFRTYVVEVAPDDPEPVLEYRGLRLRSGQIIVGDEGDADTLLMSLLGEEYSPYVHAGIVVIENNRPYVYDAYVTVNMFIHASRGRAISGGIRRATLEEYVRSQRIVSLYELAGTDRARVAEFAQARHRDETSFDVQFNWRDHSSLYCTEFVAVALQAGGSAPPQLTKVRANPSLRIALDWLQVDAQEIVTAESLIRPARRVGLISREYSLEQLTAYFSAKQELHRRFTEDQKLGNLWQWTWRGLALQPNVDAFLRASTDRPTEPSSRLAIEYFGEQDQK